MKTFTVEYVNLDEATPRDTYTKTVKAADENDARMIVVRGMSLAGDRVSTMGVMTDSRH